MEATAERAHATAVAARVAAICDKIKEHRHAGKPMSARQAAVISAMIDNVIAPADDAEETPKTSGKRKARKGAARWSEELSRLDETKPGVVVKSVRRDGCGAGDILREACFMAACGSHPSVVGYRGVTRTPAGTAAADEYSLVADSAAGPRTLADVLRDHGQPFLESDVRRIMRQLLGGVETMAERGVVHCDIKPTNILYGGGGGGAFKIAGFGAAKHAGEKDQPELFAGTNGYTAPEVLLENAGHGAPVDAWSLGCVMIELLTGKLPFAGKDKADQLCKMFDVLGVPGRKAWQGLRPHVPAGEVQQRRGARQRQVVVHNCNMLRELVPEKVLSEEGFDVLNGLLNCDPKKRLTAAAALQCPWFTDNALNDDGALLLSSALAKITTAAAESWSMVLQMAVSFAGRALQLLRPKGIAQVMIVM